MALSRKDYVAVAEVFKYRVENAGNETELLAAELIADDIAKVFKADNSRFDTNRFLTACGF